MSDKIQLTPGHLIPLAQLDNIMRHTGVDVTSSTATPGQKLAALAWYAHHQAGEERSYQDIYATATVDDYDVVGMSGVDPTQAQPPANG